MNRCLSLLAFLIVVQSNLLLAADENEKEVDTREIIREAEETASEKVGEIWDRFQTDIQAPLNQARMDLNRAITKLNEGKRFNDAKTVQKALADLEKTVMSKIVAIVIQPPPKPPVPIPPPPKPPVPIPPQKPLLERMAGKWNRKTFPEYFVIQPNGTWQRISKDGKDTVLDIAAMQMRTPEELEVRYPSGWRLLCRLAGDDVIAVNEFRPTGEPASDGWALERIK